MGRHGLSSRQNTRVVRALPRESVIEYQHAIGSPLPFANQPGSGLQTKLAEIELGEARERPPGKPLHLGLRGSCPLRCGDAVDPASLRLARRADEGRRYI